LRNKPNHKTLTYIPGWRFATSDEKLPGENTIPDPLHPEFTHIRQVYFSNDPDYTGRFTVPVLFDKKTKLIVSNEVRTPSRKDILEPTF
jgi:glutathionyl-hydroquinone reductase